MELPHTPVGDRVRWLIDLVAKDVVDEERVRDGFAPDFLTAVPVAQVVAFLGRLGPLATATVERITETGPTGLVVALRADGAIVRVHAQVEEEPPHRFRGLQVRSGPSVGEILASTPPWEGSSADLLSEYVGPLAAGLAAGGVVAGVVRGDTEEVAAFGDAPADGIFELGSLTKAFTGVLLAEMAGRGEVGLDEPVEHHLPGGVSVPREEGRQVTLVDLATHSAGLPRLPPGFDPSDPEDPYADFTVERLYEALGRTTLEAPIGGRVAYSNYGFGLLGHALGRAGGRSYDDLVVERVCLPLGLAETVMEVPEGLRARRVQGHDERGEPVPHWAQGAIAGAGGLEASAGDVLRFARANIDPGGTALAEALEEAQRPRLDRGDGGRIGLGWNHLPMPDGSSAVWHNGGTGGFRSSLFLHRPSGTAVVILTNTTTDVDATALRMLAAAAR